VGGAFFGDNLSFISDTTVVATRSQGCRMKDKFITNFKIALPAAIVAFIIYMFMGLGTNPHIHITEISFWKVLPYLVVLITAILGLNVLIVLCIGIVLTGAIGIPGGSYDLSGWLRAICDGIGGMSELILISMMAGGLLSVIRRGGGITWLIHKLTRRVSTSRGAELSIAALVSLTNLCTANNTVAILSVGPLAREISQKFGVSPRRSASLLDTFSCCIQGLIPYGAQLLMAGGLAAISPTAIIPYLYYPVLLGISALCFIFILGRKKPSEAAIGAK
jgi:Na+/H+ antiporter NhaC